MRSYCTYFDQHYLSRGLALHRSLCAHGGDFELTVLCMDANVEAALRTRALPGVRLLTLTALLSRHPALAAARADRSLVEFFFTCTPWLMRDLLPGRPSGELLTYLDSDLYFFHSPEPIYAEIGTASIAITPHRFPDSLHHLVRYGVYNVGWVSLRNDATGLACAADWADKCATWCFNRYETDRYADQKYLDRWEQDFGSVKAIQHPGVNAAPWNAKHQVFSEKTGEIVVGDKPLIFYHFHALNHLGQNLFDPSLHKYDATLTAGLRTLVYRPYLNLIASPETLTAHQPDLIPLGDSTDSRSALAVPHLLERLRASELDRAERLSAIQESQRATEQSVAYLQQVEADRDERLKTIELYQGKLKTAYADLEHNVAYLKSLEAHLATLNALVAEREASIASLQSSVAELTARLEDRPAPGGPPTAELCADTHQQLHAFTQHLRKVVVAKFQADLLPYILQQAAEGAAVDVYSSPAFLVSERHGQLRFHSESLWQWLGSTDTLFKEKVYLHANPDVAGVVQQGGFSSGWEHYLRFGQHEQRGGSDGYHAGLAAFDAVAFEARDAAEIVPLLAGRLQWHHKLVIAGVKAANPWLGIDDARTVLPGGFVICHRPPAYWIGPRLPTAQRDGNWPTLTRTDLYPERTAFGLAWPKITVVTVSYNQVDYLEETLQSVLGQNYPNLEYMVVDGGSTDGSVELIKKHAPRLAWWVSEKDRGQSEALNKGFRRATGDILTWLNSDDQLAPNSLFTVALNFLLHRTDLVVGRCARVFGQALAPHHTHRCDLPLGHVVDLPLTRLLDLDGSWQKGHFFHQPEVFFSREIFPRSGGLVREDLYYSMDYDLWVRMAQAGARALAIPEITAIFRQHEKQKTGGENLPFLPELRQVNETYRRAHNLPV